MQDAHLCSQFHVTSFFLYMKWVKTKNPKSNSKHGAFKEKNFLIIHVLYSKTSMVSGIL